MLEVVGQVIHAIIQCRQWRCDYRSDRSCNRNLSNCDLRPKKRIWGDSAGFKPVASAFVLQCSYQLSYEDQYIGSRPIYWVQGHFICISIVHIISFQYNVCNAIHVALIIMISSISKWPCFCNYILRWLMYMMQTATFSHDCYLTNTWNRLKFQLTYYSKFIRLYMLACARKWMK